PLPLLASMSTSAAPIYAADARQLERCGERQRRGELERDGVAGAAGARAVDGGDDLLVARGEADARGGGREWRGGEVRGFGGEKRLEEGAHLGIVGRARRGGDDTPRAFGAAQVQRPDVDVGQIVEAQREEAALVEGLDGSADEIEVALAETELGAVGALGVEPRRLVAAAFAAQARLQRAVE